MIPQGGVLSTRPETPAGKGLQEGSGNTAPRAYRGIPPVGLNVRSKVGGWLAGLGSIVDRFTVNYRPLVNLSVCKSGDGGRKLQVDTLESGESVQEDREDDPVLDDLDLELTQPPAKARRAPPARNVEVGGSGGRELGPSGARDRRVKAGLRTEGRNSPAERPPSKPPCLYLARPRNTGSCLLRHISGSATGLLAVLATLRRKSGWDG